MEPVKMRVQVAPLLVKEDASMLVLGAVQLVKLPVPTHVKELALEAPVTSISKNGRLL